MEVFILKSIVLKYLLHTQLGYAVFELLQELTAKASWYSNTSISDSFKPVLSRILEMAYEGLKKQEK